jgi:hypothetical protein
MSVSHIPEKTKIRLWGKAAGRCQYEGCNEPLWLDSLTQAEFNTAYIAHIVADSPNGPRGDEVLSEQLKDQICNLMLMCDKHHRLIDQENVAGHPVERLQNMKKAHEDRIELLSSISADKQSNILLYCANVGEQSAYVNWRQAADAMTPTHYPAERRAIELSLSNSTHADHEPEYWTFHRTHLERQFERQVRPLLLNGELSHLSIFAIAPQPLLILLGSQLSDIPAAEVYQLHREPSGWAWTDGGTVEYEITPPDTNHNTVALNLSLSGTIDNSRITDVLGSDVSIWTITIPEPNNDFLQSKDQLAEFRRTFRQLMDIIKSTHKKATDLNVFPACPVSVAVEIGRCRMPKADLPFNVFDQNRDSGGFISALTIGAKED